MTLGRVLVIGVGNPLRGDDGVGPAVVARLAAGEADLDLRAMHQLTPEVALELGLRRRVIFVDASLDLAPGEWALDRVEPAEPIRLESHRLTPASLLALTPLLAPADAPLPECWLCSVGPRSLAFGTELSPEVHERLPAIESEILAAAERFGGGSQASRAQQAERKHGLGPAGWRSTGSDQHREPGAPVAAGAFIESSGS